ncbi:MAG TPA: hypothetical protein VMW58_00045 [Anaerolineae bacterium]|nr:hypothetical protein [Anaerolineae bacterium]
MTTTASGVRRQSNRSGGKEWRTCFISASPLANLTTIKALLEGRGIRAVLPLEPPPTGGSLLEHVTRAISRADLFIAVLEAEGSNAERYLEIGFAHALHKRVLILASPGLSTLPLYVGDMLYIRAYADNFEAIDFALDQALAAPTRRKHTRREPVVKSRPLGQGADELIAQLERLGDHAAGRDLERLVVSALEQSGIPVVARSDEPDIGADLAIWADELESWVPNPILIEIKVNLKSEEQARRLSNLVSSYREASDADLALVLYASGPPRGLEWHRLPGSGVLFLEVRELFDRLRESSFAEIVRELRNRWAHGGGF